MIATMSNQPQKFPDDLDPIGVYIHIPFCMTRCNYCGFVSYTSDTMLENLYIDALTRKIQHLDSSPVLISGSFPKKVDSIYFGGGTPSVLDPNAFGRLLRSVSETLIPTNPIEITIEVNPGTYGKDKLDVLRGTGITRLSIGVQSLNDSELQKMGRSHSSRDFTNLYSAARSAGFENISVDLLAGYPGQTIKSIMKSVKGIIELEPDHISVYLLEIKTGSPLERDSRNGGLRLLDDDVLADIYEAICSKIQESGFRQYEISNFSKKGMESRHNMKYWSDKIFLGLGLAAHGMTGRARYSNIVDLEKYLEITAHGGPLIDSFTDMDALTRFKDAMIMGLRLTDGVDLELMGDYYGFDAYSFVDESLHDLKSAGLYEIHKNMIRLTPRGRLLSNIVFSHFL